MKFWLKVLLWIAGIFSVMLIMALGLLWWFASSVISEKPFEISIRVPDMQTTASAMKKLDINDKLVSVLGGRDDSIERGSESDGQVGRVNLKKLEKIETIELTENEVNALLTTGMTMQMASSQGADQEFRDAYFKDGALTVMISKKVIVGNPFGKYLNIKVSFVPGIQNHHFYVIPKAVSVGSIGFPESAVQGRLSSELAMLEQTEDGQAVLNVISELKLEKGRMTIIYSPARLVEFIQARGMGMGGMLGGGVGALANPVEE
ncbi:MAG TPA: hypothetical protein DET40_13495 [Lentisphaeria bacterium]|nr:MAG: hypothetical protein A2X45_22835 [Lentisphaerae bacterium GWF2_50_93]HCE44555.1 hypothetical protein [Lentisphaeria bacterium]